MKNTFEDIGGEFLAHHGREGQKWGVQNGPPYPLEGSGEAKFERQAAREAKKEARDKKKAQKRRTKILKDPKKIVRYQDEFTTEEIREALGKLNAVNDVKKLLPKKVEKLSKQQKEWAKDPNKLLKNIDSFSKEQLALAVDFAKTYDSQKNRQVERAGLPKKWLDLGSGYLQTLGNLGTNVINLKTNINKLFGGLTVDEEHDIYLMNKKVIDPMTGKMSNMYAIKNAGKGKGKSKGKGGGNNNDWDEIEEIIDSGGDPEEQLRQIKELFHSDTSEDSYAATAMAGEDFLAHYGVLGMKWGHRKDKVRYGGNIFQRMAHKKKLKANAAKAKETARKMEEYRKAHPADPERQKKNKRLEAISNVLDEFDFEVPGGGDTYLYGTAVRKAYLSKHHTPGTRLDSGDYDPEDTYFEDMWHEHISSPTKIKNTFASIAKEEGMTVKKVKDPSSRIGYSYKASYK